MVNTVAVSYSVLCVALVIAMIITLARSPLFPFQMSNLDWTQDWLIFSVIDYYGVSLCFCGIILATESLSITGALWVLGVLLLGSPIACVYMAVRAAKASLALKNSPNEYYSS
eukprot:jgi/Ulvmu1/336/UM001_0340.1